jgi:hypothetical protein
LDGRAVRRVLGCSNHAHGPTAMCDTAPLPAPAPPRPPPPPPPPPQPPQPPVCVCVCVCVCARARACVCVSQRTTHPALDSASCRASRVRITARPSISFDTGISTRLHMRAQLYTAASSSWHSSDRLSTGSVWSLVFFALASHRFSVIASDFWT